MKDHVPTVPSSPLNGIKVKTFSAHCVQTFFNQLSAQLEQPWTLEKMAHKCGLARNQFAIICRQLTDQSPIEYLNSCRIAQAEHLLETRRDMNLSQIANACGFRSSQYFSTIFKQAKGLNPSAYRRLSFMPVHPLNQK
jgi:AraC family L-rhamnose operon regulatory protein RhaS